MDPTALGFDPKLAGHAAASLPVYFAAFTAAKRMKFIGERIEMLVAVGLTAGLNAGVAVAAHTPLFPALSTATVGAVGAMITHAALFKGKKESE
jgi:hypothetical protein